MVTDESALKGIITERDILDKLPFDVGAARNLKVSDLMTTKATLVTAPSSFTLDQCVKAMKGGHFRHLPIVDGEDLKAVLSIRDLAVHLSSSLSKATSLDTTTVRTLLESKSHEHIELPESSSMADAVTRMRETRHGFAIISSGDSYGIVTERDYLTKVCVYGEESPVDIAVASVMTPGSIVKSVKLDDRIADCLSLMVAGGFRHLPVRDKNSVVNVISMRDILTHFLGVQN